MSWELVWQIMLLMAFAMMLIVIGHSSIVDKRRGK